jgi:hypothetical protein
LTYTHGFNPVPDAVKAVCLERAAQTYVNPEMLVSATRGSVVDVFRRSGDASQELASDPRVAAYVLPVVG